MDQETVLVPTAISETGNIMVKCPECNQWFTVTEATEDTSVTCPHCKHLFYPITDCVKKERAGEFCSCHCICEEHQAGW